MKEEQFPFLLKLLDDESVVVQGEVQRALVGVAAQLPELYRRHSVDWTDRLRIHKLLWAWRKARLLSSWTRLYAEQDRYRALERAHHNLSDFSCSLLGSDSLSDGLDRLARSFRDELTGEPSLGKLADYLFSERYTGNRESYYSPDNSFLSRVLRSGQGNPISLCSLFILVGKRLNFELWGCNFPGHFLARSEEGELRVYDCFHRGQELDRELTPELRGQLSPAQAEIVCRAPLPVGQLVMRVVRNLVGAYLDQERRPDANLFFLLLKDLAARDQGLGEGLPLREPMFQPGQLVSHKSKGYRGVVVDYELYATDSPGPPHEPIYRVLVHGSPQVASTRESTLQTDQSGSLVAHPFVTYFFSKFEDGVYHRNSKPWEKT